MMKTLGILKMVAELAVSTGVGAIVSNASRAAVPENARLVKKVVVAIGTFVLSNLVADQAVKYTNEKIENGLDELKKAKASFDAVKAEEKPDDEPLTGTIHDS
jgi:3-methyladenine DNA glycosylase AlkC